MKSAACAAALAASMLAGCSIFAPRLETPHLSVVNVESLEGGVWEQRLKVRMRVQNPNDRALPVKGLSYILEVAGEELAHGVSDRSFHVPALGETEFDMTVRTNMALALLRLAADRSAGRESIDYRIRGKLALAEGLLRSIPFDHEGTLRLE